MRTFSIYVKTLSTSTLMQMKKAELVEYVRMCEKNMADAYATLDQQAVNFKKLLDEQERPKGRWIDNVDENGYLCNVWRKCSHCGGLNYSKKPNYCPNCGADMRESGQHEID